MFQEKNTLYRYFFLPSVACLVSFFLVLGALHIIRAANPPTLNPPQGSGAIAVSNVNRIAIGGAVDNSVKFKLVGIATSTYILRVESSAASPVLTVTEAGTVGILKGTPHTATLDVNGTISGTFTGTMPASNVTAGDFATCGGSCSVGNFSFPANVGIGVLSASTVEKLEVAGAIKIGAAAGTADGTIRWTGTDFEGRKASAWVSLTGAAAAGGWTDGGTFVRLTDITDKVVIGALTPPATNQKTFSVIGTAYVGSEAGGYDIDTAKTRDDGIFNIIGPRGIDYGVGSYPSLNLMAVSNVADSNLSAELHFYVKNIASATNRKGWFSIAVDEGNESGSASADKSSLRIFKLGTYNQADDISVRKILNYVTPEGFWGFSAQATDHDAFNTDAKMPKSAIHVVDRNGFTNYIQIDALTAAPPSGDCDNDEEAGRMKFNATGDFFYVCSGASGWRRVQTCNTSGASCTGL